MRSRAEQVGGRLRSAGRPRTGSSQRAVPDGNIAVPDGGGPLADGSIAVPDGSGPLVDGSIAVPDGGGPLVDGSASDG
jgi:hypothetical protein